MSDYGWIITKDHLDGTDEGTIGPSDIGDGMMQALREGAGEYFRLFDDDGELYYTGRIVGELGDDGDPLTDFGMPNAGCTYMSMKNAAGQWEVVIS